MNCKNFLSALALTGLLAASLPAADKPNFSGTWKLNTSKSDWGMAAAMAPEKMEQVITHDDPTLKVKTTQTGAQGTNTTESAYTTDGKDSINMLGGQEAKTVATWDGSKLVMKSKRQMQGMDISITGNWTLSADGKTLTIVNSISAPQGEFDIKMVLEKADGGAAAVAAAAAPGGCKSNFSGNWKLNVAKSDLGPMPITAMTLAIDHKDPVLKAVTTQSDAMNGDSTISATYNTDGKESKNDFRGTPVTSILKCDGDALQVNSKLEFQGMALDLKSNWKLSADGKTMNQNTKIVTPQGDLETSYILDKMDK
jgi:hypothetical protein